MATRRGSPTEPSRQRVIARSTRPARRNRVNAKPTGGTAAIAALTVTKLNAQATMTANAPNSASRRERDAAAAAASRSRRLAEFGALAVMVAWAFNFVTVKAAIAAVPPVGFAFVRFLLAGLVLLAITRWREGSVGLPRRVAIRVALLGLSLIHISEPT